MPRLALVENIISSLDELRQYERLSDDYGIVRVINKMETEEQKELLKNIKFLRYLYYCSMKRESKKALEYKKQNGVNDGKCNDNCNSTI